MSAGICLTLLCETAGRGRKFVPVRFADGSIWGGDMADDEAFADQQELQDFLDLVMRHWNDIAETLERHLKVYK